MKENSLRLSRALLGRYLQAVRMWPTCEYIELRQRNWRIVSVVPIRFEEFVTYSRFDQEFNRRLIAVQPDPKSRKAGCFRDAE